MKLSIFGTGYVGLVTGACLADVGHEVICADTDTAKVDRLNRGEIPIYEPGLSEIVERTRAAGLLRFTTDAAYAIEQSGVLFIAVGTPPRDDGSADLAAVLSVAQTIGSTMNEHKLVVVKSTVPPGTGDKIKAAIAQAIAQSGRASTYEVCSNPEFLKEGSAVADFQKPDRIIVGAASEQARSVMSLIYQPFNRNHSRMVFMEPRSAELTKYAANAMLATKISFINEIANLAEKVGADIEEVRRGIGSDRRIGYDFIYPGAGFGGSCFPKDLRALVHTAGEAGYEMQLLEAVELVNNRQKQVLFTKLSEVLGNLRGKTIAVWGLSFKPNTDDMRDAPSRTLIEALWQAGALVRAFDPVAIDEARRIYGERPDFMLCRDPHEAVEGADALVICTEWHQFRAPSFEQMAGKLKSKLIVDGRNLYEPKLMREMGWTYLSIGR